MNTQSPTLPRKTKLRAGTAPRPMKIQYVYHWDRIIGALAVLALLIGLLGFAIYNWVSPVSTVGDVGVDPVEASVAQLDVTAGSAAQDVGATASKPVAPDGASDSDNAIRSDLGIPFEEEFTLLSAGAEAGSGEPSRVLLPAGTRVNLRAEPSLSSPVLRILDSSVELQLIEKGDFFFQVRSADGVVGWVSRDFSSVAPYAASAP